MGNVEIWRRKRLISEDEGKTVENSGQYIFALLNNLLESSRLEQGTLTLAENNFDFRKLCLEVMAMFKPLADRKCIELNYKLEMKKECKAFGDELKIKQIMINVLSNAVKYTARGSVSFYAEFKQEMIFFKITDTGAGIPEDRLDDIYKPFNRIEKNNTLASGSGLGMYVVKGLIGLLDGTIRISSKVEEGTSVKIRIPVSRAKEDREDLISKSGNILVIDDDPAMLMVIKDIFNRLDLNVNICEQPENFGKIVNPGDFELIITDMEMGPVTGSDVLRLVRKTGKDIRVVIMTGRCDYNDEQARQDGFDGYLPKPVTLMMISNLTGVRIDVEEESPTLQDMFANDREAITEVLDAFVNTTESNIALLIRTVEEEDFNKAQAVCHKMLPMFQQLDAEDYIETLKWMDMLRGKNGKDYPEWQSRISVLISEVENYVKKIRNEYLIS
jgi:CheY-like chemotaxis protein